MNYKWGIAGFVMGVWGIPVLALSSLTVDEFDPFSPQLTHPGRAVLGAFHNPAILGLGTQHHVMAEGYSAIEGYTIWQVGYVMPFSHGSLGVRYSQAGTDSIFRTSRGDNGRATVTDSFGETLSTVGVSLGFQLSSYLSMGLGGRIVQHDLDTDQAEAIGADIGLSWANDRSRIGVYATNVLATSLLWSDSSASESLDMNVTGRIETWITDKLGVGLSANHDEAGLLAEWTAKPNWSLMGEVRRVWDGGTPRVSLGTRLNLGKFDLLYRYVQTIENALADTQHRLSFSIAWGEKMVFAAPKPVKIEPVSLDGRHPVILVPDPAVEKTDYYHALSQQIRSHDQLGIVTQDRITVYLDQTEQHWTAFFDSEKVDTIAKGLNAGVVLYLELAPIGDIDRVAIRIRRVKEGDWDIVHFSVPAGDIGERDRRYQSFLSNLASGLGSLD